MESRAGRAPSAASAAQQQWRGRRWGREAAVQRRPTAAAAAGRCGTTEQWVEPEPGRADSQLDGTARAGNPGGAAAADARSFCCWREGLVMSFVVFLALLQGAPELHVSVDEDHVAVGEEILYTI